MSVRSFASASNVLSLMVVAVLLAASLPWSPAASQSLSSDAVLSELVVGPRDIVGFEAGRVSYEVGVDSTVEFATVSATTNHGGASVVFDPADVDPVTVGHQVALSAGRNPVRITVTAQDGVTTQVYTVSVNQGVTDPKGWQAGSDLDGLIAAGNSDPRGVWSNGTTMWVTDAADGKVYAYQLSDGSRDSGKDITLARDNSFPFGVWSNGTTMWVVDGADNKVFAYQLSGGSRDSGEDITLDTSNSVPVPRGVWSDGTTMWVVDGAGGMVYAYQLSDGSRDSDKDIPLAAGNSSPFGVWSDESTMWVTDYSRYKVFAYQLSDGSRESGKDINSTAGNSSPFGVWSDGTTMWAADAGGGKLYAYNMPSSDAALSELVVGPRDIVGFEAGRVSYEVGVDSTVEFATVSATTNYGGALVVIDPADVDPVTPGHQVALSAGRNPVRITVTAQDGTTQVYTVSVNQGVTDPTGWQAGADLDGLIAAGNSNPRGVWSDKTTMWVTDTADGKVYAYQLSDGSRDSDKDITLDTGNSLPFGVWSDGMTMWVVDGADNKVYAYRLSDGSRDSGEDITLDTGNSVPRGVWSDGTTMWVVAGAGRKLYAYQLSGGTPDPGKDIDLVANGGPYGVWSDESTMWVADFTSDKVFAYQLSDGSRVPDKEFNLAPGNGNARGVWSDGTTMWVTDSVGDKVYAYNIPSSDAALSELVVGPRDIVGFEAGRVSYEVGVDSTVEFATVSATTNHVGALVVIDPVDVDPVTPGHQVALSAGRNPVSVTVTAQDGTTQVYTVSVNQGVTDPTGWQAGADLDGLIAAGNNHLRGVWSDKTTMWVTDAADGKVYAYQLSDGSRDSGKDITLDTGNSFPFGVWSNGTTMWVVDGARGKLYAYQLLNGLRESGKDITLAGGNSSPFGVWSDGTTMWVVAGAGDKVYAYQLSDGSRDSGKDIDLAPGNGSPFGVWSDESTMWVTDFSSGKVFAYQLLNGLRESGKDITLADGNSSPFGVWSDGTTMWAADAVGDKVYAYNLPSSDAALSELVVGPRDIVGFEAGRVSYEVGVDSTVEFATVSATTNYGGALVVIDPVDVDPVTVGHQVALSAGRNPVSVTVTAQDGTTQVYTVSVNQGVTDPKGWQAGSDLDGLIAAGNNDPRGVWSDGMTMWVTDTVDNKVYAYRLSDGSRVSGKEFTLALGNSNARGVWSDEMTMWVADATNDKLYAYQLSDGSRVPGKEFDLAADNSVPYGIWSDGTTMWVVDAVEHKVYAYQLSGGTPDPGKDIDLVANGGPYGVWSDESTMWVADFTSDKVFAYQLSDGSRVPDKEFNLAPGNGNARGVWSDGTTMWVTDAVGDKVYAYNLPSSDAALSELGVGPRDIVGFEGGRVSYEVGVDSTVEIATVSATANHVGALVVIDPVDVDPVTVGHQVALSAGRNPVSVTVTAQDGTTQVYTVSVNQGVTDPKGWQAGSDLDGLIAAGNNDPRGVWSDGMTMWVTDTVDNKVYAYRLSDGSRVSGKEFTLALGNSNARGVWSDEMTMWVADATNDKLYAYQLSDGSRVPGKEFDLAADNSVPYGIWSDGTTMWVVDAVEHKVYAYQLSGGTPDPGKDIDLVANGGPYGIWYDETTTTMWVADFTSDKVFVYQLSDGSRVPDKEFKLAPGNGNARGVWSDGTTMWVTDSVGDKVYAYNMESLSSDAALSELGVGPRDIVGFEAGRVSYEVGVDSTVEIATVSATANYVAASVVIDPVDVDPVTPGHQVALSAGRNPVSVTVTAQDGVTTQVYTVSVNQGVTDTTGWQAGSDLDGLIAAGNNHPRGVWSDGMTMWVTDTVDGKVYAYRLSDGSRVSGKEFTLALGNSNARGVWSDEMTMWVADATNGKVYAYQLSDGSRVPGKEFDLANDNNNARGVWSDGTTMWVSDALDNRVFAYQLSDGSPVSGKDITLAADNNSPRGVWSDETTMWVVDSLDDKVYAYQPSDSTRVPDKEFNLAASTSPYAIWTGGTTMWVTDASDYKVYAYNMPLSSDATLSELVVDPRDIIGFEGGRASYEVGVDSTVEIATVSATTNHGGASVAFDPADVDSGTAGHQVALSTGRNPVRVTVTAQDGVTTQVYRVSVNQGATSSKGWQAGSDLDGLITAGNNNPRSFWSDGTTMWVLDGPDGKVYAYQLSDGSRDFAKEFDLANGHDHPHGVWSNGTTMWVTDSVDFKLYAYQLSDGTRDSGKDITLATDNSDPEGVWSNGTTLWVVNSAGTDSKVYAYQLSDGSRDPGKDITLVSDNNSPRGVWSNGTTMWVTNSAGAKLHAYQLSDSTREFDKEIPLVDGNRDPVGVWSNGKTMWVADLVQDKLYAYNMAGLVLRTRSVTVYEGGRSEMFTVALLSPPSESVTVAVLSGDPGAATVSTGSLTFTTDNWDTKQVVTVTGVVDADAVDESFDVNLNVTAADDAYMRLSGRKVAVTVIDNDTANLEVNKSSVTVVEDGAADSFTVALATQPSADVTVTVTSDDPTSAAVSPTQLTFTTDNWDTAQVVTVTGPEDPDADSETPKVTLDPSGGGYDGVDNVDVAVTVTDNDEPGLDVNKSSVTVVEGGAADSFTVALATQPSADVTVTVTSDDLTSAAVSPTQLTFTALDWADAVEVTVTGPEDPDADSETPKVTLDPSGGGYDGVDNVDVAVTVIDNDDPGLDVNKSSVSVVEDGAADSFTVALATQPSADVTVTVTSDDPTSAAVSPTQLMFTTDNWDTAQVVTVTGPEDLDADSETPKVTLDPSGGGYDGVENVDVAVTVTDNDTANLEVNKLSVSVVEDGAADSFTVALATQPSADVTVTVTSDDPTSAAVSPTQLMFTTDNWDTAQVVTVTGPEDLDADSETPKVTLDPSGGGYDGVENVDVAVTVTDNDTANLEVNKLSVSVVEDGAADSFTVALATQPSADVTVTVTSDDPTSAAVSPTQLMFTTDNWDTAQVVTVTGPEDPDADSETPKVTLDPSGGGYDGVENVDVAVTVTDNDTANLEVNKLSVSVVEDGAADSFTVALATQPSADVTVTVTSDDLTSAAVSPTQLMFTTDNWDTAQVVTVTGPEDPDADSETPKVTLDPSGGGYDGVENVDVAVTVTDNDTANLEVNKLSVSVVEDGAADSFTVALATQPSADVTVTVTSDDPTSAAVSPTQLMFTTDNWDTAQVVTVTGPEDPDADSETPKVTLDPSGGGYDGVENVDVAVTVTDNDTANLEVNKSSVSVVEDGAADSFTVALATQPSADVTVTVTSDDPTSAAVSPTQLMFTTDNWDTAQVVTVTGPEDPDADSETPKVTLDPSGGGYDGVENVDVAVTVTDNDTANLEVNKSSVSVVEDGAADSFTVALATQPSADVTVTVTSDDLTSAAVSPTQLMFTTDNWDTAQVVTVTGPEDPDADSETPKVTLDPSGGGYDGVENVDVAVTVTDNDTANLEVNKSSVSVVEDGAADSFTVALATQPSADVTVTVTSDDLTSAAVSPTQLMFTTDNWDTAQVVTVTGPEDPDADSETPKVTLDPSGGGYDGVENVDVAVTVTDNDTANLEVNKSSVSVVEDGAADSFTVALATQPSADVTVTVTSDDLTSAAVSPTQLMFTTDNWDTAQVVTVTGPEDPDADSETPKVTLDPSGGGYDGVENVDVAVTVTDNDTANLEVNKSSVSVVEDGAADSFTVALATQPSADVTVTVTSDDPTSAAVSPTQLMFTTDNWDTAQVVTVTGPEDPDAHSETPKVTLDPSGGGYDGVENVDVAVTVTDNDTANLEVNKSSVSVVEDGAADSFTVALATQPSADVTVTVTSDDPTSAAVSPTQLMFTTDNWDTAQVVTVTGPEDPDADSETPKVTLDPSGGGYDGVENVDVAVTVTDNDTANLEVNKSSVSVVEDGAADSFTVALATQPSADVTVTVTSDDPTSAAVSPTQLMFTTDNWDTAQVVTVTGPEDLDADSETPKVTLDPSGGGYDGVENVDVAVTVTDNDTANLEVNKLSVSVVEDGAADSFTVALATQPSADVTVTVTSDDPTSAAVSPTQLMFTTDNWDTAQVVTVTGPEDLDADSETPKVTLDPSGGGYDGVENVDVAVTVTDNDTANLEVNKLSVSVVEDGAADSFTVALATQPSADVTVTVTSDDPTSAAVSPTQLMFTTDNWDTAQVVTVTGPEDPDADSETPKVTLDPSGGGYDGVENVDVAVTVTDNDTANLEVNKLSVSVVEDGAADSFTVALATQPSADVTVTVTSDDPTSAAVSPTQLMFTTDNWDTAQVVTVTGPEDPDADSETPKVTLDPSGGGYDGVENVDVAVTVTDNDTANLEVNKLSVSVVEDGAADSFTVALATQPSADVTVTVTSDDPTSAAVSPTQLMFTTDNWDTAQVVTVTGPEDPDADSETPKVTLDPSGGGYDGVENVDVAVTVTDNDTANLEVNKSSVSVVEDGAADSFTVALATQPSADVTVTVTSDDPTSAAVSPTQLMFTTDNWDTAQVVTVTGPEDPDADSETPKVTLDPSGGGYDGVENVDVAVTVTDNDTANLEVNKSSVSVVEDGAADSFTVALATQPSADVTVTVTSDDLTSAAVSPTQLMFTTDNWDTAQVVTVTGPEDPDADSETPKVTLDPSGGGYDGVENVDVAVTVTDNDTANLEVNKSSVSVVEDGAADSFTVALATQPSADVTVTVTSDDLTSAAVSPTQLMFTTDNWDTAQVVTVTGPEDPDADSETPKVTLDPSGGGYDGVENVDVAVTVTDNDTANLEVNKSSVSVVEDGAADSFTVALATQPSADVTVTVTSDDPTSAAVSPTQLMFTTDNWDTAQVVTVTGPEDPDADSETPKVTLDPSGGGYDGVENVDVAVTVTDNDTANLEVNKSSVSVVEDGAADSFTVALATQPSADVTVTVTSDDPTSAAVSPTQLMFTTDNWDTAQVVTVTGPEDPDAHSETPKVTLDPSGGGYDGVENVDVAVTVTDNDTANLEVNKSSVSVVEDGAADSFTVALATQPSADVTVTVTSDDPTSAAVSPTQLMFTTDNWDTAQVVTVTGPEDPDAHSETPKVTLDPSGGGYDGVENVDVAVTVTDNDTANLEVNKSSVSVVEDGAADSFTVALATQPSADVTVTVTSDDPTSAAVSPTQLMFTTDNWDTAQVVTVTGPEDPDADSETPKVTLDPSGGGYDGVENVDVAVTVTDNDTANLEVNKSSVTVVEDGAADSFTVALATQPSADVTVTVTSDDPTSAAVSPTQLMFTTDNWDTAQVVTVTGPEDLDADSETPKVTLDPSGGGYDGVENVDVAVTVTDNDTANLEVNKLSVSVVEDGAVDSFTVALATQPSADVTVTVTSDDPTSAAVSPTQLMFTTDNWDTAQVVTVTGPEDPDAHSETPKVTLDPSGGGYDGVENVDVAVTVTDNDTANLEVNKSSVSVVEDGAADSFTVALATQPSADVTVTVTSDDPTSAAVSPTQLMFTTDNWDTAQVVTVTGPEDPDADSETPKVTLDPSGGGYDGVENVDVAVTVTDNDTANLEVNKLSVSVVEDGAADSFTVALATQPSADVTVTVTSDDPTSAAVSPTQLMFTTDNWDTAQVVTVTGPEDPDADSETPKVTLDPSGGGYDGVENVDVAVTVTDNDTANLEVNKSSVSVVEDGAADSFTVALATQPSADVTVTVTSDDLTSAAVSPTQLMFTTDNWDTAQVVTVTGPEDPDADSETPKVTLDPSGGGYDGVENVDVAVTVTDNDTANLEVNKLSVSVVEDGAVDSFTVALATQPSADVTVTVTSDDPTSAAVSPTQLMFTTDNWDTAQVVTVTGPEDLDADSETPKVTLDPSGGGYDGVENVDVAVTVTDNDTANLEVNKLSVSVVEDGAVDSFTVALATQPSADVTVTVTSDDPTSAAVSPTQLMFTTDNWDTAQVVTVTGPEDLDADSETPKVTLDPSGGGYDGVENVDVAVTVTDNDEPGLDVSETSLSIDEGDTGSFTVVLATQPSAAVEVAVTSGNTDAVSVTSTSLLEFTTSNWDTAQTVVVSGVEDTDAVDGTAIITVAATSAGDNGYNNLTPKTVSVSVVDDDEYVNPLLDPLMVPDEIRGLAAYFTVAYGDNRPAGWGDTMQGEGDRQIVSFRAIWSEPLKESPADEWQVSATAQFGASDLSIEVRYRDGRSDLPELIGSVTIDGYSRVKLRVRGRYGQEWSGWSPIVVLRSLP